MFFMLPLVLEPFLTYLGFNSCAARGIRGNPVFRLKTQVFEFAGGGAFSYGQSYIMHALYRIPLSKMPFLHPKNLHALCMLCRLFACFAPPPNNNLIFHTSQLILYPFSACFFPSKCMHIIPMIPIAFIIYYTHFLQRFTFYSKQTFQ
jgi:hypothetical protein